MIVDRYYYSQLNKEEQEIYKVFYKGVMELEDIIPIPIKGNLSKDAFIRIYVALTKDNPLIYYLNQSMCEIAKDIMGNTAILPRYFFTKDKVKEYNRKIEKSVNELIAKLDLSNCSDYEKALRIHDWFCKYIEYDKKGSDKNEVVSVIASHNILGVFAYKKAQCEGIAKAAKVLLNTADVKCIVVTGEANGSREKGPHAWNIVSLDGIPYQLDVTWDLEEKGTNTILYDYFLVTDKMIEKNHKQEGILPTCSSIEMNYFMKNKLAFSTKNQLLEYVEKCMTEKKTNLYFRVGGQLKIEDAVCVAVGAINNKYVATGKKALKIERVLNKEMGTCRLRILY